jgi:outer membrane protein OmpA-like peptidoglycan-associated protein
LHPQIPVEGKTPPPGAPDASHLSSAEQELVQEVIRRIQQMPTMSQENKEQLLRALSQAKEFRRVAKLSFAVGQSALAPRELATLRAAVETPEVKTQREDPTVLFLVLGYADITGTEDLNLNLSRLRGLTVLRTLTDQLNVHNAIHAVPMGASTLLDANRLERNRTVEVWVVGT